MSNATQREALAGIDEVARYVGLTRGAIYVLRHRGRFAPAMKVAGKLRWRWTDLDAWLSSQADRPRTAA